MSRLYDVAAVIYSLGPPQTRHSVVDNYVLTVVPCVGIIG